VKRGVGYVVTRSRLRKRDRIAGFLSDILKRFGPTASKRRFSLPHAIRAAFVVSPPIRVVDQEQSQSA
jgi:hypothetical protein